MKANELRIGNLIKWISTGEIEVVKDIETVKRKTGNVNNVSISDCVGIELTEEWLIKFCFEKKSCGYGSSKYVKGIIELHNYGGDIFKNMEIAMVEAYGSDNEEDTISVMLPYDVMYVHELQNIYSIFTREELELKQ